MKRRVRLKIGKSADRTSSAYRRGVYIGRREPLRGLKMKLHPHRPLSIYKPPASPLPGSLLAFALCISEMSISFWQRGPFGLIAPILSCAQPSKPANCLIRASVRNSTRVHGPLTPILASVPSRCLYRVSLTIHKRLCTVTFSEYRFVFDAFASFPIPQITYA